MTDPSDAPEDTDWYLCPECGWYRPVWGEHDCAPEGDDAASHAPWTPGQVAAIRAWQSDPFVHPLTCGNRDDDHHWNGRDFGVLDVSSEALICPDCDYRQTWVPATCASWVAPDGGRRPVWGEHDCAEDEPA